MSIWPLFEAPCNFDFLSECEKMYCEAFIKKIRTYERDAEAQFGEFVQEANDRRHALESSPEVQREHIELKLRGPGTSIMTKDEYLLELQLATEERSVRNRLIDGLHTVIMELRRELHACRRR